MTITYAQLKAKIEMDMDTEDELFVQETELMEYVNDAIRAIEGDIHRLGLQVEYYKKSDNPSVVSGTSEYALPSDIYENSFIECVYNDGSRIYEIKEIKGRNRHARIAAANNNSPANSRYGYHLTYPLASGGKKWVLVPTPQETSSTRFTRWYMRTAQKMTGDASICDLPEACYNFLYAYVYYRIWAKEGDGRAVEADKKAEQERQNAIAVLTEMSPDDNNEIEMDTDIYDEMS